jgi:hypothetical protein
MQNKIDGEREVLEQVYTAWNMESTNLNTRDSSVPNTLVRIIH